LLLLLQPPATKYPFTPLTLFAISCGIIILVHQAFTEEKSKWWIVGLLAILFANSIFLLLPEFRGYAFYGRGDTPTHLGYIKDILATGHIGEGNFYPIEHVLATTLIQVTNFDRTNIPSLFFVLFSGVYILNILLLAKIITNQWRHALLPVVFASPLVYSFFHVNIHPNIFALFMLPLLLYFYHRREQFLHEKLGNTLLLLLLILSITFFHPVIALFSIIVFLVFGFLYMLYSSVLTQKKLQDNDYQTIIGKDSIKVSVIISMVFFIWYFSYSSICGSFKRVFNWLIYQIGTPLAERQLELLAEADLTPLQTVKLFINRYGAIFLMLSVSIICLIFVFHRSLSKRHNVESVNFVYAAQFIAALLLGVVMLFGYFIEYNPVRVARFPLLMGTILSGLVVYSAFKRYIRKNQNERNSLSWPLTLKVFIIAAIIVMATLSLGSVYKSPRTCNANHQITQMEIVGTRWFEKSKKVDIPVVVNSSKILHRFEDYNFGIDSSPIVTIST